MDRVKAIEVLKPLANSYVDYANITMKEEDDNTAEALEMAIEALKAQLFLEDTTSDLIDRQAVIKVLEHWKEAFKENSHHVSASDLSLVVKDVKELPTAQPEPQEGEWVQIQRCARDAQPDLE